LWRIGNRIEAFEQRHLGTSVMSLLNPGSVLVVETSGRRTGRRRWAPVAYWLEDTGAFVVGGGAAGMTVDPDWVRNLRARPDAAVWVRRRRVPVIARELTGEARDEAHRHAITIWRGVPKYERRSGRAVPYFRLVPATDVVIRPFRAADAPAWQGLFSSLAAEGRWIGAEAPAPNLEAEILDAYLDSDRAVLLLADVDGVAVGWITGTLEADDSVELGMAIIDGYRGRGIGTRLMTQVLEWAAVRTDRVKLDVFPHNEAAIALYRKLGFVDVEVRRAAWPRRNGERWDLVAMERRTGEPRQG
jgi:deazaflavin-dependent oxidoreductase (nitroreductase family)